MIVNTIDLSNAGRPLRAPSLRCDAEGCEHFTKGGKFYCGEHCDRTDRFQEVLAGIERRRVEVAAIKRCQKRRFPEARIVAAVPVDGMICNEIMGVLLEYEECTLGRLGKELADVEFCLILYFVQALENAGFLRIYPTESKRALRVSLY